MSTLQFKTVIQKALIAALLVLAASLIALPSDARAAPAGSPWGANYFPNVTLVNQDGKKLRFYDDMIKGKVVMINFMYATCHDACPLETAKLRQVQEALGDRVGKDIFMYSITITPAHDTPAVLKEYAEKFKVGPGWQFMTGKEADITLLRKKLGLYDEGDPSTDHSMNMIVGNEKTGEWRRRSTFDNPKMLARVVGDDLFNFARPRGEMSYAQAPGALQVDPGEDLFRRRCQVCHTVGAGDALGPDLLGVVANRDHDWLKRWLKNPDKLLAAKDPIATALYERYNRIPMPNLRLSEREIEVLIGYMDKESRRIEAARQAQIIKASESHYQHKHHDHHQRHQHHPM